MLRVAEKCLEELRSTQHRIKNAWQRKKVISMEEKCLADQKKKTRHSREMLGRAKKCSAQKKRSSAEQQYAYKRSIVLVGHSNVLHQTVTVLKQHCPKHGSFNQTSCTDHVMTVTGSLLQFHVISKRQIFPLVCSNIKNNKETFLKLY